MKNLDEGKQRALEFIRSKRGPVLVGEIALFLGPTCSLNEAEKILSDLAQAGTVRRLTPKELEEMDLRLAYVAV